MGFYAMSDGSLVPTFRDNLSVQGLLDCLTLEYEMIVCPEISVTNCHSTLRKITEEQAEKFVDQLDDC
jgi:hypothetical protein